MNCKQTKVPPNFRTATDQVLPQSSRNLWSKTISSSNNWLTYGIWLHHYSASAWRSFVREV
ncbi:MAG: hypothetical protein RMZ43_035750, partial [Nostoc sp. CmiVER01]|uniref:hypothetical protein n=1 Tax=Nostoc sp. CmiVER01 TaxID=3075384 RepID=UPI003D1623F2